MQKSQCLKISKNVSLQITRTDAAFGGWCEACGAKLASLAFEGASPPLGPPTVALCSKHQKIRPKIWSEKKNFEKISKKI